MARLTYDDSDAARSRPLDEAEVDVLIAGEGRGFVKDARLVMHFVGRVKVTIASYRRQLQALQRSVDEFNITRRTTGHPVEVAVAAVAALDDSGRRQVLDRQVLTAVARAEEAQAAAERARTAARSEANRVRFALASVLDDNDIPTEVRGRIHRALDTLPASAPEPVPPTHTARRLAAGASQADPLVQRAPTPPPLGGPLIPESFANPPSTPAPAGLEDLFE